MIAPVKCGVMSAYMASVTGLISDTRQVVGPRTNGGAGFLDEVILLSASRKRKKALKKRCQKRGATRGLPRRSPILVLISPKHA